jgi:lysophospholipase L1-like esterase
MTTIHSSAVPRAAHHNSHSARRHAVRILVVGDSVASGAVDVDSGRINGLVRPTFVDCLREEHSACEFHLDAAPFRRTADLPPIYSSLLDRSTPDVVLVATGSNDADIDWRRFILSGGASVRQRSRPADLEAAVRTIGNLTRERGARLILTDALGIAVALRGPVLDRLAGVDVQSMMLSAGGQDEADRMVELHRSIIHRLAAEVSATVALPGLALRSHDPRETLGPDGLHPAPAGHRAIADALSRPLRTVLNDLHSAPASLRS